MVRYTQHSQQSGADRRAPYYVPTERSGNLFQKIKGFFNSSSSNNNNNKEKAQKAPAQDAPTLAQKNVYDNVNVSNIDLSLRSNLSYTCRNPNDTLSEFFNKKGDTPLNDIEIEGVLSLIRKSQTSRAPSRNNSTLFSTTQNNNQPMNHSMFLNSNMDSKLAGLSSLNDINNTTILRPASDNMKAPVRIHTPTYVPRKFSGAANTSTSALNAKDTSNLSNRSLNSSYTSRSFNRPGGAIRKRRIVDYSALQSQYKVKTSSSLATFLEKKKLLEKKEREEKQHALKGQSTDLHASKTKNSINYSGGIIDLSHLDDDDEESEASKEQKERLKPVEPQKLSKTASKVLDILNFDDAKKTNSHQANKEKKEISKTAMPTGSIITIDDSDDDNSAKIAKTQPKDLKANPTSKFEFRKKDKVSEKPAVSESLPAFNFKTKLEPAKNTETIEPVKEDKPPQFSFKDLVKQKDDKAENEKKTGVPTFSFGAAKDSPAPKTEGKSSVFNFGAPMKLSNPKEAVKIVDHPSKEAHALPQLEKCETKEPAESSEDVEIIDSFEFPEVDVSPITTDSDNHVVNGTHDSTSTFNDKPTINSHVELKFEFPPITSISPQTLELVEKEPSDLYKDVFRF